MAELPADWLEKSAANARAKMKPSPFDITVTRLEVKSEWIKYKHCNSQIWEEGSYLTLMRSTGGSPVIRGVIHRSGKWLYQNKVVADHCDFIWLCRAEFNLPKP
jgi:hypothetical protein